jgi:hypothetical protein
MDTILLGRRTCPKCGEPFIIENNLARMMKNPNASVKPAKNARKSGRR